MDALRILVTGSTDGIGRETAFRLIALGHDVIIHGRNQERITQTLEDFKKKLNKKAYDSILADFSSLEQVNNMAEQLLKKYDYLDVIINNAGVFKKEDTITKEGLETTFTVNHLAPFLLTNKILPLLKNAQQGRIVNVSSRIHASGIDFSNLMGEKHYDATEAYSRSKLANLLFTKSLSRELSNTSVTANALHPGVINTKLLEAGFGPFGKSVHFGADTSVHLATEAALSETTGEYFDDMKPSTYAAVADDIKTQDRLWEISESIINQILED